jgi:FkbM family methyltransferase
VLPVFRRINLGDITIRHHWTGDSFRLHSFKHKGYWWYGRKREPGSMALFAKLVRPGDVVFDIGSHIGYTGLYFSWLTGQNGQVYCFEPSPANLSYLDINVATCPRGNIRIVRAAAGDRSGEVPFFVDGLTGQTSTIVPESLHGLEGISKYNGLPAQYEICTVPTVTADSVPQKPDFVKIDVEAFELSVLKGMEDILRTKRPRIMVETSTGSAALSLLAEADYVIHPHQECNVFAVPREDEEALRICANAPVLAES